MAWGVVGLHFDDRCRNQGGSIPIEGGVLATCANQGDVWAFEEGQPSPSWTLEASCGQGGGGQLDITRGIPVTIE
ncbi:MAG TPA: hypothetical protein ENK18_08645 [Deltaproteobacteria bacterium]|nr:hypothetical protein [Deltaproteobacteria bacterium]